MARTVAGPESFKNTSLLLWRWTRVTMNNMQEVTILLDEYTQQWIKEAMDSFWQHGDGYIEPVDPLDEFMDEVREMLYD